MLSTSEYEKNEPPSRYAPLARVLSAAAYPVADTDSVDTASDISSSEITSSTGITTRASSQGKTSEDTTSETTLIDVNSLTVAPDDAPLPVSWITMKSYGSVGMLMTEESHRGKGLASLVTRVCADRMLSLGLRPVAHVDSRNAASVATFRRLGWKQAPQGIAFIVNKKGWK